MGLDWLHSLIGYWPWLMVISSLLLVAYIGIGLGVNWLQRAQILRSRYITLQLTPPAKSQMTSVATQELFKILHGYRTTRSLKDKILQKDIVTSFEIVSTKQGGISYEVRVRQDLAENFQQSIHAYLPAIKIKEIAADRNAKFDEALSFKQTGHFAFPLAEQFALDQHDPVAYLTNAMTKLDDGDQIRLQLVVTPVRLKEARLLAGRILGNEDIIRQTRNKHFDALRIFSNAINGILFAATNTIGEAYHGTTSHSYKTSQREANDRIQIAKRLRPARTLSAFELELMESMHRKVNQPLFRVNLRMSFKMHNADEVLHRKNAIRSALTSYDVPSYQSIKMRRSLKTLLSQRKRVFIHRLPDLLNRRSLILSASELAGLYHFPSGAQGFTDNLQISLSRTLAAPVSLKQNDKPAVILGQNVHHGVVTPIGLTDAERERHVYIIGGTGNGKTTMLQYAIVQDMQNGKGLAIVDPHGDMAEAMLGYVPEKRIKDVIYFNPDDIGYPIGLNLLELPEGLMGDDLEREKDLVTESVISVFRKIFSDEDNGGHRIEYVLRNTIQTALTIEGATLFTIFELLNNPKYRKSIVKTLENKDLVNFWKYELGQAGDMQRVKMAAGITAKIGRFLFSASAKRILEQPKSTIDFEDIINSGKILICNFSKGLLGEDTSELFGITVLAKLQLASLRRARLAQAERKPFYLYVDEFQNFATTSFVQMLSESRKYKLFLTMAEQSTSQQKDQQMVNVILANVGTVVYFRTGNPADESVLLPLFKPYISEGEISNLSSFKFYAKLSGVKAQEPLSGQTQLLKNEGSVKIMMAATAQSRARFATKQIIKQEKASEAKLVSISPESYMQGNSAIKAKIKMLDV